MIVIIPVFFVYLQQNNHFYMSNNVTPLLAALREQKAMKMKGGIYHKTQIDLTDTCLTAQDQYKAVLSYFWIEYV